MRTSSSSSVVWPQHSTMSFLAGMDPIPVSSLQVRMQFDQADEHAARAFGMDKGMPTARIAEGMADEPPPVLITCAQASSRCRPGNTLMQARTARLQEFAQVRLGPQRADDLETTPSPSK